MPGISGPDQAGPQASIHVSGRKLRVRSIARPPDHGTVLVGMFT